MWMQMQSNKFASFNFQVSCPPHSPMLQQKTYKTDLGHSRMETTICKHIRLIETILASEVSQVCAS